MLFAESVQPLLAADRWLNLRAANWLAATIAADQRVAEQTNTRLFQAAVSEPAALGRWPPILQVVRCGEIVVAAAIEGRNSGLTPIVNSGVEPKILEAAMVLVGSELVTVGPHITMLAGPGAAVEFINTGVELAGGQVFRTTVPIPPNTEFVTMMRTVQGNSALAARSPNT